MGASYRSVVRAKVWRRETHSATRVAVRRDCAVRLCGAVLLASDRSYVVWNVVAAKEFSADPERWCFPFAGCVAYRGFFARDKAERFQAELTAEGLDTYSG